MKQILKEILNDLNEDNSFYLGNVDWDALKEAVKDEGVNAKSDYDDIKEVVIDLFESVGYEEFGVEDSEEGFEL